MFKSKRVRQLEEEFETQYEWLCETMAEKHQAQRNLLTMTKARDVMTIQLAQLQSKCERQADVLATIAKHGRANPSWSALIARAAIESDGDE